MKLSESTAVIRPRRGWEAIDLGIRMVQRDFGALSKLWLISTLPWYVLFVSAAQLMGDVMLGTVLFWWMKPAYDRVILNHLSQRLFSQSVEDPGPFDLWFRLPFSASVWRQLTYLRLSLVRTFTLPVYQLEGAKKNSGERISTLINRDYGASAWLTLIFALLNSLVLYIILGTLIQWLHPNPILLEDAELIDMLFVSETLSQGPLLWTQLIIFYLVTGVLELFFVGAGFALYINRRTHLEAWDIELSFRRLADRLTRGASASAVLLAMLVVATLPPTVDAQETASSDATAPASSIVLPPREQARSTAIEIYEGDEFGEHIQDTVWREKATDLPDDRELNGDLLDALSPSLMLLASLLKFLVVGILVLAIGLWLYRERKRLLSRTSKPSTPRPSTQVQTQEKDVEFTPDVNVPDVVMRLWSENKSRESLSYLYRSALSYLVTRHNLLIGDHATEEDCLMMVRANASSTVSTYFSDVTRQWRLLAYGKRRPEDDAVASLCHRWTDLSEPTVAASTHVNQDHA